MSPDGRKRDLDKRMEAHTKGSVGVSGPTRPRKTQTSAELDTTGEARWSGTSRGDWSVERDESDDERNVTTRRAVKRTTRRIALL